MNGRRFDRLTCVLGRGLSRRRVGALITALGLGAGVSPAAETDAKKKKCPVCRIKKRGKCKAKKPDGAPCGGEGNSCRNGACVCFPAERACSGRCCPEGQVCDPARNLCANTAACAAVTTDACVGSSVTCNGNASCECLRDVDGATHCGTVDESGAGCNVCQVNQDCVDLTDNNGAFCVVSGSNACCGPGQRMCRIPCPT
jgi:hypothetical protein